MANKIEQYNFKKGTRVFNMYHGRGTVLKTVHKPKMTPFGKRGTFRVKFDRYGEQDMNSAQIMKLSKRNSGRE